MVVLFVTALVRMPPSGTAMRVFAIMQDDMQAVLAHGGTVVEQHNAAKPSTVFMIRTLSMAGWSRQLAQSYGDTLRSRRWVPLDAANTRFCKAGMVAEIRGNAGMRGMESINTVTMNYDLQSVERCKRAGKGGT